MYVSVEVSHTSSLIFVLYYLSVPFSVEEEMAPCVPGIKLGRFQVNCPSHYITFVVPRHHKLSLL